MRFRFPIRRKLAVALVVPLGALLVASVAWYRTADAGLAQATRDKATAIAATGPGRVVEAIQVERDDIAFTLVGLRTTRSFPTASATGSMARTDAAVRRFERSVQHADPAVARRYRGAITSLRADLDASRARFRTITAPGDLAHVSAATALFADYTTAVHELIDANDRVTATIHDPALRSETIALSAVGWMHEQFSQLALAMTVAQVHGGVRGNAANRTAVLRAYDGVELSRVRVEQAPPGPWDQAIGKVVGPTYWRVLFSVSHQLDTGELDVPGTLAQFQAMSTLLDDGSRRVEQAIAQRSATLTRQAHEARDRALGGALLALLGSTAVALLAARSISKPLRSLARQAGVLAAERLPSSVRRVLDTPAGQEVAVPDLEPIAVRSHDEVQEVSAALSLVQATALDLAVEQAVLGSHAADSFSNLGQRTQRLIDRQLELVSDLEREESEPDALEQLFKLDHLTTRARRNAESLVVLAGVASPRIFAAPISTWDIVRSALGEVEDYQRVTIKAVDEARFPGASATALVHVLAELIENGLAFSPPDRTVEVVGRRTTRNYVISVIDEGPGMTADELATANRRLAGGESYTVAPSRYLGHYVAGRLAERIGVAVSVKESPAGGLLAKVTIPLALIVEDAPTSPADGPSAMPESTEYEQPAPPDTADLVDAVASAPAPPNPPGVPPAASTAGGLRRRTPGAQALPNAAAPGGPPPDGGAAT